MNENETQGSKTLNEQLELLKQEQVEAERIYHERMQMGTLAHNPSAVQELAETILERKMQIDELEAKIEREPKDFIEDKEKQNSKALTVYNGKNPVLKWLQKMMNKLEEKLQNMEKISKMSPLDKNRAMFEKEMENVKGMKDDEYNIVANMKSSKIQESKTKSAHQQFVDQLSGNGLYHTFGTNAKNMEGAKNIAEQEKMQNNEIQENNKNALGR
ncbi:MAG: hypothetical protein BHW02_06310 [Clostridium sp. 28_12]|jgi:bifunctional N-acetylglucosamine-1-phosphate-uridyltransferase/glucosamine-1-phosphate-acetyltransferase GlmU-like protein|nr:MAG: hypothetical protein BHW02_06310 [Clostridium sp. 28_12]